MVIQKAMDNNTVKCRRHNYQLCSKENRKEINQGFPKSHKAKLVKTGKDSRGQLVVGE